MTVRSLSCIAAASIIATSVLAGSAALACEKGRCNTASTATAGKPLPLKKFTRKPVATSAVRTVKKKNGQSAKAAIARQAPIAVPAPNPDVVRETTGAATSAAAQLPPAAAQAFASYELARVRVVTPEDIDSAQLLSSTALAENAGALAADNATMIVSHNAVQVVSAEDVNVLDQQADSPVAVSLDTLSRDLAGNAPPSVDGDSWFSRLLVLLGSAFTAMAAVVRTFVA
jgi:hypothetical protein